MTLRSAIEPLSLLEAERQKKQECYLCRDLQVSTPEGKLTGDHIPPKNLFLKPRPSLITVPCCEACNHASHLDDDYLRLAVCGYYNTTALGKRTWKEKAVGSTVRKGRLPPQVQAMNASLKRIALLTPQGVTEAFEMEIERVAIERVLIRITRGFLAYLYPTVNRTELTFRVTQLDQFKVNDPVFARIASHLSRFELGHGVFRCWHGVESYSLRGLWVHMFFGSAWYQVEHVSDRRIVLPW